MKKYRYIKSVVSNRYTNYYFVDKNNSHQYVTKISIYNYGDFLNLITHKNNFRNGVFIDFKLNHSKTI